MERGYLVIHVDGDLVEVVPNFPIWNWNLNALQSCPHLPFFRGHKIVRSLKMLFVSIVWFVPGNFMQSMRGRIMFMW